MNKILLIGHLGKNPEMRYTPDGRPVTTFVVLTSRNWEATEVEKKKEMERFHVVAWGNLAEMCSQRLTRGTQIYVEGRLQSRRWVDNEGVKHNSVEIVAYEILILGNQQETGTGMEENLAAWKNEL